MERTTSAEPLATFRIAFGVLIFISMLRFWAKGWINELYIEPKFFFTFYGFEFVTPLGQYIYLVFAVCIISSLLVAIGLYYRVAIILLFTSFTYIELIDKSTYLNHYYFISMISLLMIFLPAHAYFSFDAARNKNLLSDRIPKWNIDALKFFVCILYFYAGLAKVNSDWLLEALPLRIWLPAKNDIPLIGEVFNYTWTAYAFSWAGCLYDLSIPFLLLNRATRSAGFVALVVFHLLTSLLFPIGMFPYIMIVTALIFFSADFHHKILGKIARIFRLSINSVEAVQVYKYSKSATKLIIGVFTLFFLFQLTLPFRHILYSDELFWTEEGYRFSWRVMLMEKAGYAQFTVKDSTGNHITVNNRDFLTPLQEKMMSTQPDMILQFAHHLADHYQKLGVQTPQVYVDAYVALNGRLGKTFIDPTIDLARETDSFRHKTWIEPFDDEISGL